MKKAVWKNIFGVFAVAGAVVFLQACSSFTEYRYWNIYTMTEPAVASDKSYNDENISVRFWLDEKKIHFKMKNVGAKPFTIDWERASFINVDGEKHPLSNGGSIFTNRRNTPAPTTLQPEEEITDFVAPVENVDKLEEWTWYVYPLFNLFDDKALKNKGQKIGVDLPVQIDGKSVTYAFRFKVAHVVPYLEHAN